VPPVRPVGETGRPVGETGQTGLLIFEQARPVKPVQCTGQTGPGRSVLRFLSIRHLCWFSFSIATPNFGQNA